MPFSSDPISPTLRGRGPASDLIVGSSSVVSTVVVIAAVVMTRESAEFEPEVEADTVDAFISFQAVVGAFSEKRVIKSG